MAHWNVPQALIWAIYRDRARVNALKDKPPSCMDVLSTAIHEADGDENKGTHCCAARNELADKFSSGQIVTYGIPPHADFHTEIPPIHWKSITTLSQFDAVAIPAKDVGKDGRILYRDVLVDEAAILAFWPPSEPEAPTLAKQASRPAITSPAKREAAYKALVNEAIEIGVRQRSEAEDVVLMKKTPGMGGISRDDVRALRREHAPKEWLARGRRKKTRDK